MDPKLAQNVAEYIQLTDEIMADQKGVISKQAAELVEQKQASEPTALAKEAVEQTIDNCIGAQFIKEAEREQAIQIVTNDPGELLGFLDKLAAKTVENRKAVPVLGRPATQKTASVTPGEQVRESDTMFEAAFDTPVTR